MAEKDWQPGECPLPGCLPATFWLLFLSGCAGEQSTYTAAGVEAASTLTLYYWLFACVIVVWLLLAGIFVYATRVRPKIHSEKGASIFVIVGGIVLPTLALTVIAIVGIILMTQHRGQEAVRDIRVTGEQYWWRFEYLDHEGKVIAETANEFALPVAEASRMHLITADVIHSFWVPALAGKVDMIPGRINELVLEPIRTGRYRGQCAEFCGASHALMGLVAKVKNSEDFQRWLSAQADDARPPATPLSVRGQQVFLQSGCGACHAVRGTPANGRLGPDLTHLASRDRIAAATFANDQDKIRRWLAHTGQIKPGVQMPTFDMLSDTELAALAAYLGDLQ